MPAARNVRHRGRRPCTHTHAVRPARPRLGNRLTRTCQYQREGDRCHGRRATHAPDRGWLSLEQIERKRWGDAPSDATYLVHTAHELRRTPIGKLAAEDLRLMIGQKIGVDALMPYALALLASNPLTEGHFYPGDLLTVVMRQPPGYWATHPGEATAVRRIATAAKDTISSNQCDTDFLLGDIDAFLALTERHA